MDFIHEWYIYLLVFGSGAICGVINTLAGGGSFITLPILMLLMPANEANVTNRLGFLFQSVVASWQFKKKKTFEWSWGLQPAIPLLFGTIIGALIAVNVDSSVIRHATGILLICMLPIIFLQPEKWLKAKITAMPHTAWWVYVLYFLFGIYAGFLQAGVGYFLLIVLVMSVGYDLLSANSIKVFVVLFISVAALTIFFIFSDKVKIHYDIGLTQAVGQGIGAYLGVKFATSWSPKIIRWLLIIIIVAFAIKLFLF